MARSGWKALSGGLAWLLSSQAKYQKGVPEEAPPILAIVANGPNRLLLQTVSREAALAITLSETLPALMSCRPACVPPIIVFDRELAPDNWRDIVSNLTKLSPRPYVILLSPIADANLWDELHRAGGSDILRTPISRDSFVWAVSRAWQLWKNQEQVRSPKR